MSAEYQPDEFLNLTGVPCPLNSARAIVKLELMDPGEVLEIVIDDGEPVDNVPVTLMQEGHPVVHVEERGGHVVLWALRGEDL